MLKQIQWFPGHMSKTLKEFKKIRGDLYILLLDSRAPDSTFVDTFIDIIKNKKIIIFLTKSDLVKNKELKYWVNKYKSKASHCLPINLREKNNFKKNIQNILESINFKSLFPKIIILGVPNVGKSTLLNIIFNKKKSKVENKPGVTKNNVWFQFDKKYWFLDTPGVLQPKFIDEKQAINLALIGSIKLDILPLEKICVSLAKKLIDLNKLDSNDPQEYIDNLLNLSQKKPNEVYKKFIKDFQNIKFGKIILD